MINPLSENYSEQENKDLVKAALNGDRKALDKLVRIHQPFIYNVAWKMAWEPEDALDLTQEVLIKVITKLSQFNFESQFRTWLYRIVVNEFLQTKRRKGEAQFSTLEDHGNRLDAVPGEDLTAEEEIELQELAKETQFRCLSGMLMCLTREQRLIFILGDTFAIDHNTGAEIFNISKENFRVKLHRARKELCNFMDNKCGLINSSNPCRCAKKSKYFYKKGLLSEDKKTFNVGYKAKMMDFVSANYEASTEAVYEKHTNLFRDHPAKDNFNAETIIEEILNDENLMQYFQ
ncbi:MAG: RNA polymerase sigma factor [Bacteroidota bacterium]